ncbi:MAG: hypothetical protein ABIN67_15060 [Ferruginibacter sp.]
MKRYLFFCVLTIGSFANAQVIDLDVAGFDKNGEVKQEFKNKLLNIEWPSGSNEHGKLIIDLRNGKPLIKSIQVSSNDKMKEVGKNLEPSFLLTIGKRDLVSQNGWNIFFDRPNKLPHKTYKTTLVKKTAKVFTSGSRTVVKIGAIKAGSFTGSIEITLFNGSPLLNIAAVMLTDIDSAAILYDAGLVSKSVPWQNIGWNDVDDQYQSAQTNSTDTTKNLAVKYRSIVGVSNQGSLAIFPAPHQYFYPLDEAFNLKFTWYGNNYRNMFAGFGMGIRQEPDGDHRWVPWFNAPPGTEQRLNFFCLLSTGTAKDALNAVKQFTHNDTYKPLPGYKTMSSHFHNEYVMNVVLANKELPGTPNFVKVFKQTGIDIVHLAEFHYTAHPKGPDEQRLTELKALFDICSKFSDDKFLLLPGEEPNEFFGGHWLAFFPKPVYWIMSKKEGASFITDDPSYGKVYRIGSKEDMLQLLEAENGLAWTAHARTKGSTGYPDKYKDELFFKSENFFGAAWKPIPADLSQQKLGKRVLDLMDDMANWGNKKHVIAEADLFTIEPENEMYAHLNVNYLQLDHEPAYKDGWQPVMDVMRKGKFFVSTGEVLMPVFTVNGKQAGDTIAATQDGKANIVMVADWTFPLNFAEIITGDGVKVYREKINLDHTLAFGKEKFSFKADIKNKKWIRVELWDAAVNGAFSQQIWIE